MVFNCSSRSRGLLRIRLSSNAPQTALKSHQVQASSSGQPAKSIRKSLPNRNQHRIECLQTIFVERNYSFFVTSSSGAIVKTPRLHPAFDQFLTGQRIKERLQVFPAANDSLFPCVGLPRLVIGDAKPVAS